MNNKNSILRPTKYASIILCTFTLGCQTAPEVGSPSSHFDGQYTFEHNCDDDLSSKFDGSNFIISEGMITNNRGGAARYFLNKDSRIDGQGNLIIQGMRREKEIAIYGNLLDHRDKFSVSSQGKSASGGLSGYIKHNKLSQICVAQFNRIGGVHKSLKTTTNTASEEKLTVNIASKNTTTEYDLLMDRGEEVSVEVELQDLGQLAVKGLAIIVSSSTPNMEDEVFYGKKMRAFGLATAIVNGAAPRFTTKFSARYTSSMIVRDLIATLNIISLKLPKPKQIIVMGSSTGAYGIFKIAWEKLQHKHPQLRKIDKAIMINAVCPEHFESGWSTNVEIYTANGREDDSTPAGSCEALLKHRDLPNLKRLIYQGAHHFESPRFGPTRQVDGMHIIPTCSLNINERLFATISRRDGTDKWETEKKGVGEDYSNWLDKSCVRRGHRQGYDTKGGPMFWTDVKSIVNEINIPSTLQGQPK